MTSATDNGYATGEAGLREKYRNAKAYVSQLRREARKRGVELETDQGRCEFASAGKFIDDHPSLAEPIIDGLCRRGETVNVIGSTKEGKSWLILGMALSIAAGRPWLGRDVTQGRVALIDNELQPGTLSSRIRTVAHALTIPEDTLVDDVLVLSLRGNLRGLKELRDPIEAIKDEGVVMVGLDAFYRFMPQGFSENDNAQMATVYNDVDQLASILDACFVLNHHSSKGDQSGKSVTDVGSGAGSISRAADTHLILRPHNQAGLAVLDAACRSFPPIEPSSIAWQFPLWGSSNQEPQLRQRQTAAQARKEANDTEADQEVLEALADHRWRDVAAIETRVSFGRDRVKSALGRLTKNNVTECRHRKHKSNGRRTAVYRVNNDTK